MRRRTGWTATAAPAGPRPSAGRCGSTGRVGGVPAGTGSIPSGAGVGRAFSPLLVGCSLVGVLLVGGCGEAPVAPLPGQWPSRTPGGTASSGPTSGNPTGPVGTAPPAALPPPPPAVTPRRTSPTGVPSPTPDLSPACLPPVIYPVDGSDSAAMPRALCLTVASVLRVQNVGPGTVTATPAEMVAQHWEGGVVDCRLLAAGTVTVEIAGETGTHTITVFVVE